MMQMLYCPMMTPLQEPPRHEEEHLASEEWLFCFSIGCPTLYIGRTQMIESEQTLHTSFVSIKSKIKRPFTMLHESL